MRRMVAPVILFSMLAGCAGYTETYEYRLTTIPTQPRMAPDVYMRGTAPPIGQFAELAVLQVRSNESLPAAVAALQRRAGQLGADALVDVRSEAGAYEYNVIGTAIVWLAPPASRPGP